MREAFALSQTSNDCSAGLSARATWESDGGGTPRRGWRGARTCFHVVRAGKAEGPVLVEWHAVERDRHARWRVKAAAYSGPESTSPATPNRWPATSGPRGRSVSALANVLGRDPRQLAAAEREPKHDVAVGALARALPEVDEVLPVERHHHVAGRRRLGGEDRVRLAFASKCGTLYFPCRVLRRGSSSGNARRVSSSVDQTACATPAAFVARAIAAACFSSRSAEKCSQKS